MAVIGGSGPKAVTTLVPGRLSYLGAGNGAYMKDWASAILYAYSGNPNLTEVFNLTASGFLTFSLLGSGAGNVTNNTNSQVIITIDGNIVINESSGSAHLQTYAMQQVGACVGIYGNGGASSSYDAVAFNTSLRVQVKSDGPATYYYSYYLT